MQEIEAEEREVEKEVLVEGSDRVLYSFDEMLKEGKKEMLNPPLDPRKENDLATVIFTSGSTGTPKGVPFQYLT